MPEENQQPPTPPKLAGRGRVIQPVSDMSEYVSKQTSVVPQPEQAAPPPPPPSVEGPVAPKVDTAQIYPTATRYAVHAASGEPTPAPPTAAPAVPTAAPRREGRVGERVPAVQVYAFLIIIYAAYTLVSLSGLLSSLRGGRSFSLIISPELLLMGGVSIVNLVIGIYLLIAKNLKTVSSLLTALLIIGGLALLNSVIGLVRVIEYVSISSVVAVLISMGLLMYLWSVKAQVDLAVIE